MLSCVLSKELFADAQPRQRLGRVGHIDRDRGYPDAYATGHASVPGLSFQAHVPVRCGSLRQPLQSLDIRQYARSFPAPVHRSSAVAPWRSGFHTRKNSQDIGLPLRYPANIHPKTDTLKKYMPVRDLEIKNIPNIALSFRSDLIIMIDKNRRLSRAMLRIFLNHDDRRWLEDGMRDG